jgi:nicotinamide mononucleotide adenylyltransferase
MLKLAISSSDWIKISEWETQQDEWTKTISVLEHHQKALNFILKNSNGNTSRVLPSWIPENITQFKNVEIKLLCGGDMLESFEKSDLWTQNDVKGILSFGVVVVNRKGSEAEKFITKFNVLRKNRQKIIVVPAKPLNETSRESAISSTVARYCISRNLPTKHILNENVAKYIAENSLFK